MSLKDQAQQMAKRCSTVSYYSSHHKAQSDSSGGDAELSPKERHVIYSHLNLPHSIFLSRKWEDWLRLISSLFFSITSSKQRSYNWLPHNDVALPLASRAQKPLAFGWPYFEILSIWASGIPLGVSYSFVKSLSCFPKIDGLCLTE